MTIPLRQAATFVSAALVTGLMTAAVLTWYLTVKLEKAAAAHIDDIGATVSPAATRAVLILDADLAQEICTGLLENAFITEVSILEDNSLVLATAVRGQMSGRDLTSASEAVPQVGASSYVRHLALPDTMASNMGRLVIRYDNRVFAANWWDQHWLILSYWLLVSPLYWFCSAL